MSDRTRLWIALVTVAAITAVALAEAARTGRAGLAVLLAVSEAVLVGTAASLRSRAPVSLRGDLVSWLEEVSAIGGESASTVADRAVSAYRRRLEDAARGPVVGASDPATRSGGTGVEPRDALEGHGGPTP
ncbi:MAG: hypothetical protein OEY23_16735 [Acidimicrobiia bacterium]|nr:hypothetical protein [Acidimicrobiia bacterium]